MFLLLQLKVKGFFVCLFFQLYLTGAVYSLDGSDSLKETMQTSIGAAAKVTAECGMYWPHVTLMIIAIKKVLLVSRHTHLRD